MTTSIRPLPDEAVAQIKSSTAIVSLTGVVLELLKNALDAKAAKIHVTVDFARGGCTVEDDGLGLAPAEFREDGGLGKLYYTSKYQSDEPHLGQHGTFLASLSAMSLLTITSHHHAYRSHNSISFHHSRAIERQTPTTAHNHVHGKHGTRVVVRNLFGNMPVRVKQRSIVMDQKAELHRLREALKKDTVALLLSWQSPISLKIQDNDNKTIGNFNTSHADVTGHGHTTVGRPRSAHLSSLLHIMTQAGYLSIDNWASWVPASASTAALSVKGAISLEPSPGRHVQFISFGLRPLSSDSGHNELYDQVNRLFALSSFGALEDDVDVDDQEKLRRQSDKRFKNDGYTNRQLKARKGVDRYPMFHLSISLKDGCTSDLTADRFIEDKTNLQAVVEILNVMISQWLSVHHFRPRKLPHKSEAFRTACESDKQEGTPSSKREALTSAPAKCSAGTTNVRPTTTNIAKRKRLAMAPLESDSGKPRQQAFAEWSRIKSGKSSFFDSTTPTRKTRTEIFSKTPSGLTSRNKDRNPLHDASQQQHAAFNVAPISRGALSESAIAVEPDSENDAASTTCDTDGTVMWTDPSTSKTYLLNARTGCMMPPQRSRPQTDSAARMFKANEASTSMSLRMAPKPATAESIKTPWLDGLLQSWENPVFRPSEKGIQRASLQDDLEQGHPQHTQHSHLHCSHFGMQKAFTGAGSSSAKLSKEGLHSAQVISQVDKKFVLVKMMGSPTSSELQSTTEMLVLIDQHAADERVRVESLLADLCNPGNNDLRSGYQSKLGLSSPVAFVSLEKPLQFVISPQEHTNFRLHAASFAAWGILYDISSSAPSGSRPGTTEKETFKLLVTTLPPVVLERCKGNPQLLISFLRSAVWKYAESPPPAPAAVNDQHRSWLTRIATCPPGLVDMINSRACRSAIMFNDELSLEECRILLNKLADCIFPFMCAHGRPSMVPIVDLQSIGGASDESEPGLGSQTNEAGGFVKAWKKWKR
ncbi:hypothetical protein EKO04_008188 [Ascochyta lentis]|uniref:MutL C-terminal dimerisation domain-containing protein n=1 Tax=Ascochyta lentis TaxID=205686 RepID=A0A8H7MGA1_9PLEO|nr:hypothetical protein EKO04_008188 [Ascochyta lentis]